MRQFLIISLVLLMISVRMTSGQDQFDDQSYTLEDLYSRLVNNYNDADRIRINDSIKLIIDSYAKSEIVFEHRFSNLKYLGQVTSSDSLLKILTWNLVLAGSPGRYYCYFIRKNGEGTTNQVLSLTTEYKEEPVRTDTTYSDKDWYGALYYDLRPYKTDSSTVYVLLGIDYGNMLISRKIIDVLEFSGDGSPIFGRKWFSDGNTMKFRDVFEYASNGMMSLRFNSGKSIVFDHLVPFSPSMKNDRQYYGPDYSYDAYNYENGLWKLVTGVDVRNN